MKIVGSLPHMENIATLIDPPCSAFTEQSWLAQISGASGCGLLLDLHNLHANATNFGYDPLQFLDELPLEHGDVKGDLYEYLLSKLTTALRRGSR